jgi:long-chain fatty acid transport protein
MKLSAGWCRAVTVITGLAFTPVVSATTGYWGIGYGAKAMGLAGAVVSNPQDSIAASTNPAGMALVGERFDVGMRFFTPQREATLETSALGATFDVDDESRSDLFKIPNFGYTSKVNDQLWWGISVYGNGGLNTTYDRNLYDETAAVLGAFSQGIPSPPAPAPIPPGPGAAAFVPEGTSTRDFGLPVKDVGTLGVDLKQALFVPTLSFRVTEDHTFGASLLLGLQRFQARGLGNFQCFTGSVATNPANAATCPNGFAAVPSDKLTNNGYDWSYGAGVRVGWIGDVHSRLTLGAAASSKVYMTEFDDYEELFAEDGDFDIPASVTVGATFKATPKLNLSFDFQRIFYEGVNSISNEGPVFVPGAGPGLPSGGDWLGKKDGLGFGWEDVNVYRVATEYFYDDQWTWRAGFLYTDQVIPDDQVLFNILAPATVQKHVTVGFTFSPDKNSEWNFAYMHAFEEKIESSQTAFGIPGEIKMHQNSLDVSYSYKF